MKILHCIYDHTCNPWVGGGGAVRVREIYRRLAAGHEITVLSGRYPGAAGYSESGFNYEFLGTDKNSYLLSTFCYAVQAAGYVKANADRYDVIVEDFAPYNPLFSFLRHENAVVQLHQREGIRHLKKYAFAGLPFLLIEKYYPGFFKNAVTISEMSREKYGLKGKAAVIPNGFDGALLDIESEEGDYVLFLGRLHIGQKGLDILSRALEHTGCRLIIAGGGKDEAKVRELFRGGVQSGRVEFAGFVDGKEKTSLLGKCLFMTAPSRYEGQPLTLIEAAACAKPVIVSDIPELRYAVDAGFGLSFKAGDAKNLAEKMDLLLRDPSLRREMGIKGRSYASNFTWDRIAVDFETFLLGVTEGNSENTE